MRIAHLTDLHVSTYGARMTHQRVRIAKGEIWQLYSEENGWMIEARSAGGIYLRDVFRLVDPEGRVHLAIKARRNCPRQQVLDQLRRLRDLRLQTHCLNLALHFPKKQRLAELLSRDPDNGNLRFCAAVETLSQDGPDWIVITGDLTDDGVGYNLLQKGLAPFIEKQRVLCIPGNHDVYSTPPLWNDKELRQPEKKKRQRWNGFLKNIGLKPEDHLVHELGEKTLLARLDSCHPSKIPGSASGYVPLQQFDSVAEELNAYRPQMLRLVCLHHPLVRMPYRKLGLASYQPGMRLRNARRLSDQLTGLGVSLAMNGHRHVGYYYQPESGPVSLSAPSTTYGCLSGAKPFYWCIEVLQAVIQSVQPVTIPLLANA